MRLTPMQREAIRETVTEVYGGSARVLLFGSRVDDARRGGDIDLLVETDLSYLEMIELKHRFLAILARRIGERRVDVVLVAPDSPAREIVRVAQAHGVAI